MGGQRRNSLHKVQVCPASAFNEEISDESSANIFSAGKTESPESRVSPTGQISMSTAGRGTDLKASSRPLVFFQHSA